MSFLVPAFLAGLLALAIPIWVHLRNRPKRETVEFPSLMFLERIPVRAVQKQQLRNRVLLAMRCLALVLLALAFARPFFGGDTPGAAAASGSRELVVAVDRSWSMGYGDHWTAAVGAVGEALDELRAGDRVSLVLFDTEAEVRVGSEPDPDNVRASLASASPGEGTTDLGAGLRAARELLAASSLPVREVVLVSDFQRSGWDPDADVELPEGTLIRGVNVASEEIANVTVADVTLDRAPGADPGEELLTVSARITRVGAGYAEVEVGLEVAGTPRQSRTLALSGNDAGRVVFEPLTLAGGPLSGTVRISPDELPGDDSFHFAANPGQALSVLVLDSPDGSSEDSLYLRRALAIGSRPAFRVERTVLGDLAPSRLEGVDVIVLNDVGSVDAGNASVLEAWVAAGGGLVVSLGELSDGLGALGGEDGLLPFRIDGIVDRSADLGGSLGHVDIDHPVFEPFASPGSGDLTAARFFRYRTLRPVPREGVLARYDQGAPALVERRLERGRVLVWTSTLDAFWTDLPLQPVYLPLIHRLVAHAADFREPRAWLPAAAPVATGELLTAAGLDPDATGSVQVGDRGVVDDRVVRLAAGIHTIGRPGDAATGVVAVNLDRSEADLAAVDPEEVAAAVAWTAGVEVVEDGSETRPGEGAESSQSLWWYLVLFAFLLLAVESVLSNRLSSRAS